MKPAGLDSGTALDAPAAIQTSGQLHMDLRRKLLESETRAVDSGAHDVACQLVSAYEALMRAGM